MTCKCGGKGEIEEGKPEEAGWNRTGKCIARYLTHVDSEGRGRCRLKGGGKCRLKGKSNGNGVGSVSAWV